MVPGCQNGQSVTWGQRLDGGDADGTDSADGASRLVVLWGRPVPRVAAHTERHRIRLNFGFGFDVRLSSSSRTQSVRPLS